MTEVKKTIFDNIFGGLVSMEDRNNLEKGTTMIKLNSKKQLTKRFYYCDFKNIYTSIILNKNYELTISYLTDNEITNTENYVLPNETINNFHFNYDGVLFNVDYNYLSEEIDEMYELINNCANLEHQFKFVKPKTIKEMELFVEKIKENPYLKLKLIT